MLMLMLRPGEHQSASRRTTSYHCITVDEDEHPRVPRLPQRDAAREARQALLRLRQKARGDRAGPAPAAGECSTCTPASPAVRRGRGTDAVHQLRHHVDTARRLPGLRHGTDSFTGETTPQEEGAMRQLQSTKPPVGRLHQPPAGAGRRQLTVVRRRGGGTAA